MKAIGWCRAPPLGNILKEDLMTWLILSKCHGSLRGSLGGIHTKLYWLSVSLHHCSDWLHSSVTTTPQLSYQGQKEQGAHSDSSWRWFLLLSKVNREDIWQVSSKCCLKAFDPCPLLTSFFLCPISASLCFSFSTHVDCLLTWERCQWPFIAPFHSVLIKCWSKNFTLPANVWRAGNPLTTL